MNILETPKIKLPQDVDELCVSLCDLLNRMPETETYESCCGHSNRPFSIFFHCTNIGVITRLGRCISHNYSDGYWELLVDTCDTRPNGCFWLRTNKVLSEQELKNSIQGLEDNIIYYFGDDFDNYFDSKA